MDLENLPPPIIVYGQFYKHLKSTRDEIKGHSLNKVNMHFSSFFI